MGASLLFLFSFTSFSTVQTVHFLYGAVRVSLLPLHPVFLPLVAPPPLFFFHSKGFKELLLYGRDVLQATSTDLRGACSPGVSSSPFSWISDNPVSYIYRMEAALIRTYFFFPEKTAVWHLSCRFAHRWLQGTEMRKAGQLTGRHV